MDPYTCIRFIEPLFHVTSYVSHIVLYGVILILILRPFSRLEYPNYTRKI